MSGQAGDWTATVSLAALVAAFSFKHFLADFLLQNRWIALGKGCRAGWVGPLAAHAGIHAALALALILLVRPSLWWLAPVDLVVHFTIDRGKTLASLWGRWTPEHAPYWWLFGFDQFLHQLTNTGLALALVAF